MFNLWDSLDDLSAIVAGSAVFTYPLVSSKALSLLGFKGCIPLRLSPIPLDPHLLLLSRERAKGVGVGVRGRGKG